MKKLIICFLILLFYSTSFIKAEANKKVLVLVEKNYDISTFATGQARQLVQLLGHFKTDITIHGLNKYKNNEIESYDAVFYVGYSHDYSIPETFRKDVLTSKKQIVWINTGLDQINELKSFYGFEIVKYEDNSPFNIVRTKQYDFEKGSPELNYINLVDKKKVEVWASSFSTKTKKELPYMIKSGNLIYVADLPFKGATENDRYLFFSDKLHDILNENHEESHKAILRIEDVTPLNDPNHLREIADILSEEGISFLVGVVPIYINPIEDRRLTLTDKPELVDALKYMVENGGHIVMHGVTHQYRGISTDDFEFWDGPAHKPIHEESAEDIDRKIEMGLDEFAKNGLYPIAWETPHYTASNLTYQEVSKYFSTAVEQRMAIENYDYGQYFPYIIYKDIYGQKIYPENLGYIPMNPDLKANEASVRKILKGAHSLHQVRDGIASCFFHPFLNLELLKQLVKGFKDEGYTFENISKEKNFVKTKEKIILTGSQSYSLNLNNSFLHEMYLDNSGNVIRKNLSDERYLGKVKKDISLNPGEMYYAEATDFHMPELSFTDKAWNFVRNTYDEIMGTNDWQDIRAVLLWNQYARGASYNDQSAFVSALKSLNINVDTVFVGQNLNLKNYNLVVVPFSSVDSLTYFDVNNISRFVKDGGNLITDRKNKLIEKLGFKFLNVETKIHAVRDRYYPQEYISWRNSQLAYKFDYEDDDQVFCEDVTSGLITAVGRKYGEGKIIYFNTAFDPTNQGGYGYYPFVMEYVKKYLNLKPVFKRESLAVYFDPGLRQTTSVENLIKMWVKQGIRIIHVSGWHQYPKYNYDYNRLIKLAHANGMLVYAWIEPPQVSQKFWQKHPEWREKNYKNEDVRPSWRYPVALTDAKCVAAIIKEYTDLLSSYNWDGVNFAELYFEAGRGFEDPNLFTPFHPSAIAEFRAKYGFNMKEVLEPTSKFYWKNNSSAKEAVVQYRVNKINALHDHFLKALTAYAKTKDGFKVMLTFMDSHFSPEMREFYGVNSDDIIQLQKKYPIYLQVEDPQIKWSTTPTRYIDMGQYYGSKVKDSTKLLIDLNVLAFRKKDDVTPFPTLVQTGTESYQIVNYSSKAASDITVYSEATCNGQDLWFFPYALASKISYKDIENGYEVSSPYSFMLQLPENIKIIVVDGQAMVGYRENTFFISAGTHTITMQHKEIADFSTTMLQPQVLSFTGNILKLSYDMQQINFNYESEEKALISLNNKPTKILVDGQEYKFEVLNGNDCFSAFLPTGKHDIQITTGDRFSYGLNLTSLWSISAIAIYGTLAALCLIIMFFVLKIVRRRLEN